ncbi:hypothetical protein LG634_13520 [Streptomyces bambusae]|uniref:hypothetical protein n=1 Tax=Streptomyces bambusae TaxID=1550616 RepID=UPI001CFE2E3F|nr:hypothetical protein [Streptomyces bambusae]MCB5165850.1 hypothetical protein [Streptomyces bambusae]
MSDVNDFAARLRAEQEDGSRQAALAQDRKRRRRKQVLAGAAGLAVLGGFAAWLVGATSGERAADDPFGAAALEQSMWPQEWPATEDFPYRGSAAAGWAEGENAVELPPARALGGMSEAQVEQALLQTKEILVAANFERVPYGEVFARFDPGSPALAALAGNPVGLVTRFDRTELVQHPYRQKARGRITYAAAPSGKGLVIKTDHTFVHPVASARDGAYEVAPGIAEWARVLTKRRLVIAVRPDSPLPVLQSYAVRLGNVRCEAADGLVHTYFRLEARAAGVARDTFNCPEIAG